MNNVRLSFYDSQNPIEFTSPIRKEYFNGFPFDRLNVEPIAENQDEMNKLVTSLNEYFKAHLILFQFPTGLKTYVHEIWVDAEDVDKLSPGYIPINLTIFDPGYPNSKGSLTWKTQ